MPIHKANPNLMLRRAAQILQSDIEEHLTAAVEMGEIGQADDAKDEMIPLYEIVQLIHQVKMREQRNG